jgi:hypothetical protein
MGPPLARAPDLRVIPGVFKPPRRFRRRGSLWSRSRRWRDGAPRGRRRDAVDATPSSRHNNRTPRRTMDIDKWLEILRASVLSSLPCFWARRLQATARAVSPRRGDAGFVPLLCAGRRRIASTAYRSLPYHWSYCCAGLQAFSCDCSVQRFGSLRGLRLLQRSHRRFSLVSYMPLATKICKKRDRAAPGSSIRCDAERLPEEQGRPASLVQQAQAARAGQP